MLFTKKKLYIQRHNLEIWLSVLEIWLSVKGKVFGNLVKCFGKKGRDRTSLQTQERQFEEVERQFEEVERQFLREEVEFVAHLAIKERHSLYRASHYIAVNEKKIKCRNKQNSTHYPETKIQKHKFKTIQEDRTTSDQVHKQTET